ncbi:MAG TPA: Clp1/GlmU family protein [Capsulimonadaceae bacterium]|nr:Clp1/GlmU family protein [Capsulimonadaceae bacterium]
MPTQSHFKQTTAADAMRAIAALPPASRILLVGATDTGKTAFAREAINYLTNSAGVAVALIDADIGQSEIGPPGTVGLTIVSPNPDRSPLASLHSLPLADAFYVGATAPPGHLLDILAGVSRHAQTASRELCPEGRLLIDTPGYTTGPAARALFRSLIAAVEPALLLGFAYGDELAPILGLLSHRAPPPVVALLRPGPEVGRKSAAVRSARRSARLAHFLAGASPLTLCWDSLDLLNSPLGSGTPLAPHLVKFIGNALGPECLYAEKAPDGALYAILSGQTQRSAGLAAIEEQFKTRHIALVPESLFHGLTCGLLDSGARFLNIGLIQSVDYLRRAFVVHTAVRRPEAVAQLVLGSFRARADGRELGSLRPGSV